MTLKTIMTIDEVQFCLQLEYDHTMLVIRYGYSEPAPYDLPDTIYINYLITCFT
jgi:hypothetical protein